MDDFRVKYWSKEDKDHMYNSLGKTFKYTTDYEGNNYCGLRLHCNYKLGYAYIYMPGYVPKALQRLQYKPKTFPQHSPHTSVRIQYGKKGERQYATTPELSPRLPETEKKSIQKITGSFLYYERAMDSTM